FVPTNKARGAWWEWLRGLNPEQKEHGGKTAFERALKTQNLSLADLSDEQWQLLLDWRGLQDKSAFFTEFTTGKLLP
ncbi:hypothetical protein J8J20_26265, partial [Mycobacterium tuberculosis]|nr:hypothetical protein [Mycobacterium tuberculosis]